MAKPILAALAIVMLGAGSMLLIALAGGPAPDPPAAAEPPPARERRPPSPLAPSNPPGEAGEPHAAPPPEDAAEVWRPDPAPASGAWESIAPVNGFAALGRIGPGLRTALDAFNDDDLAQCFDGSGDLGQQMDEEGIVVEDTNPVLLLRFETLRGAVRIAGATVEKRGGAGEALLACALARLRGTTLAVPAARSGARHVLRWTLGQRTAAPLR